MDPHFMFNTLNSIASLVYDQRGNAAVGMIVSLSEASCPEGGGLFHC
jgi:LytS/YehU family sensor histidine kinase